MAFDTDGTREMERVTRQVAARLETKGLYLTGNETSEQLAAMADAVERFENVVEARGGDLMMDEPPPGKVGQPDDRLFALPLRHRFESVGAYLSRIEHSTRLAALRAPRV